MSHAETDTPRNLNGNGNGRLASSARLDALYRRAFPVQRNGVLFSAFPYPTKISPEAIALFIAAHTKPGDTVFDGFAGSGTTGVAALLCEDPPDSLRQAAAKLGINAKWGPRNAVLYELGVIGTLIGRTLSKPPAPSAFRNAAEKILREAECELGWMYDAIAPSGETGRIRHIVWTDRVRCPRCENESTVWDGCVSLDPAKISSDFLCPSCGVESPGNEVERLTVRRKDDVLGRTRRIRDRLPARIDGATGSRTWSRRANDGDMRLLRRIARVPVPESIPVAEIPWGDLYRRGYHTGITHLHHFYTRRNLIVFGSLWERASQYRGTLGNALKFWLLSYNSAHATIMTRVVAKTGQRDLVVTSAQPGVLYISGLPVEKNLFAGLRRKLKTIARAFEMTHGRSGSVEVHQRSSCEVDLPNASIDYVFTDPPFGANIPYAEINFINEAWLRRHTNTAEEAIVSNHQGKNLDDYEVLLCRAFSEVSRILKQRKSATVVFHSASAGVWHALQAAYEKAGLSVGRNSVLAKTQGSFKQVTTNGAVRGDPVLELCKRRASPDVKGLSVWKVAKELRDEAANSADPAERTPQRLYSRLVGRFLSCHQDVPVDAETFYGWVLGVEPEGIKARGKRKG